MDEFERIINRALLILAAIVFAVVALAFCLGRASADDRRYLRGGPGYDGPPPSLLYFQEELVNTGVWLWEYRQDAGAPSIKPAIEDGHRNFAEEHGIVFAEVAGGNIEWARTSSTFYYGDGRTGGCPGAVGCLPRYENVVDGSMIWYDAQVMATFIYASQVGVVIHEDNHAIADAGEMYVHTRGISCTSDPTTVMDCGIGHALKLQPFDNETIRRFLFPRFATGGSLNFTYSPGDVVVWYGPSDNRTKRIAVIFRTYAGYEFFSGQYLDPVSCSDPYVCAGAVIENIGSCTTVLLNGENGIAGSFGWQMVEVGTTPCF